VRGVDPNAGKGVLRKRTDRLQGPTGGRKGEPRGTITGAEGKGKPGGSKSYSSHSLEKVAEDWEENVA